MKNRTTTILVAFGLLLCFITGQAIVFTHSHVASYSKTTPSKHSSSTSNEENCKICQANHNATALLSVDLNHTVIYGTAYKQVQATALSYQSISLVLAATRGPPLA
ncbi:hypothetical protein ACFQZS_02255 [Mucilaginibacter calamicampi]|uniref:Uncharacterized protein n=1 Tax=Mucilaginibacter calamicampi TaxID=1302352 RepID=A0ABW2YSW0_9SPHI